MINKKIFFLLTLICYNGVILPSKNDPKEATETDDTKKEKKKSSVDATAPFLVAFIVVTGFVAGILYLTLIKRRSRNNQPNNLTPEQQERRNELERQDIELPRFDEMSEERLERIEELIHLTRTTRRLEADNAAKDAYIARLRTENRTRRARLRAARPDLVINSDSDTE